MPELERIVKEFWSTHHAVQFIFRFLIFSFSWKERKKEKRNIIDGYSSAFRCRLISTVNMHDDLNLAHERHKIRTTADKSIAGIYDAAERRRNKSSFLVAGEGAEGKEAVTTIWLCFAAGKTCVACSYIILYGRQRWYPSFIQRRLRLSRNIWRGVIYTGIKMSTCCWYHPPRAPPGNRVLLQVQRMLSRPVFLSIFEIIIPRSLGLYRKRYIEWTYQYGVLYVEIELVLNVKLEKCVCGEIHR